MSGTLDGLPKPVTDVLVESSGRSHRRDVLLPRTGGPAGNAQLTAWLGLLLLALILVELVTTLDVQGMLSWHVAVGALLVPYALAKTATTSWRFVRYYRGNRPYAQGGPPPLLLRALGPLVVLATLGLLGTGVALILLGPSAGQRPFVTILGQGIDDLTLHQVLFIVFCVVTGLHLLARFVPALTLATGRVHRRADGGTSRVPGPGLRVAVVALAAVAGVLTAVWLVSSESGWQHGHDFFGHRAGAAAAPPVRLGP